MRLFLILSIFFYFIKADAQNCKPTINVTVNVCGNRSLAKDSLCIECDHCPSGLRVTDTSFSIISYTVEADGAGFEEGVEVFNTGAAFNEAKKLISKLRRGNYVAFKCIKAKDKNDNIYTLQPLVLQLH